MKKQEVLFKKIGNILNELNDQYQFLSNSPEHWSEIELELFLANANFLVEHIQIIKKLTPKTEEVVPAPLVSYAKIEETKIAEIEDLQPVVEGNIVEISVEKIEEETQTEIEEPSQSNTIEFLINKESYEEDKFDFESKSTEQLFDRKLSTEEEAILAQRKKVKENLIRNSEDLVEDEIGPEPFLVHDINLPIAKETTVTLKKEIKSSDEEAVLTLNEILAQQASAPRINDSKSLAISDLKEAITLNDKLIFIKDLFNGYNLAYAEAIEIVNRMPNFDAADNFLQKNYAEKYSWADKQATTDKFYLLINRRFKD